MVNGCVGIKTGDVFQEDLESVAKWFKYVAEIKNKALFITGATGLVGSYLIKSLLQINRTYNTNIRIYASIRDRRKAQDVFGDLILREELVLVEGDITKKIVIDDNIDFVIHTASATSSKYFVTNPVDTLNIAYLGTKNVLEFAVEKSVKSVVYISSMEVYGITDPNIKRVHEKDLGYIDVLSVRSSYSEGKRICECLCASYASQFNVPVKIARLAQTFGAGVSKTDNRAFAQFAKAAINGENIVLHTTGDSVGNYCYTADAVRGIFTILFQGTNSEAYNVVNEATTMKIKEVAELVANTLSNGKTKICFDIPESALTYGYAPDVTMRLSSDKLKQLGWCPTIDLKEMFQRLAKSWGT